MCNVTLVILTCATCMKQGTGVDLRAGEVSSAPFRDAHEGINMPDGWRNLADRPGILATCSSDCSIAFLKAGSVDPSDTRRLAS